MIWLVLLWSHARRRNVFYFWEVRPCLSKRCHGHCWPLAKGPMMERHALACPRRDRPTWVRRTSIRSAVCPPASIRPSIHQPNNRRCQSQDGRPGTVRGAISQRVVYMFGVGWGLICSRPGQPRPQRFRKRHDSCRRRCCCCLPTHTHTHTHTLCRLQSALACSQLHCARQIHLSNH
ncbi:hypothetical protein BKA80DRAFT_47909 [Phyllosticta citrichinensis]